MEGVGIAGIARWLPDGGSLLCCSLSDDGGSVQRNSSICEVVDVHNAATLWQKTWCNNGFLKLTAQREHWRRLARQ